MPVNAAFSLAVSPPVQVYKGRAVAVEVTNRANHPVTVRTAPLLLHASGAQCHVSPSTVVRVSPASFTVKPGQSVTTRITVANGAPAGDYGITYSGGVTGAGAMKVVGAVGSQVTVGGKRVTTCGRHVAAPASHSSGVPVVPAALAVLGLLLVALAALAVILRRRRHRLT